MHWRIAYASDRQRVALMASREDHCLLDLLWRQRRGELEMDVVLRDLQPRATCAPRSRRSASPTTTSRSTPETQAGGRGASAASCSPAGVDLVVLARYMQILSRRLPARVGCPVINIHHSFLPAFAGADPYRRAYERGVKLIGATAHYVTEELDEGPIIEQDVQRVGHRYTSRTSPASGATSSGSCSPAPSASHSTTACCGTGTRPSCSELRPGPRTTPSASGSAGRHCPWP